MKKLMVMAICAVGAMQAMAAWTGDTGRADVSGGIYYVTDHGYSVLYNYSGYNDGSFSIMNADDLFGAAFLDEGTYSVFAQFVSSDNTRIWTSQTEEVYYGGPYEGLGFQYRDITFEGEWTKNVPEPTSGMLLLLGLACLALKRKRA